MCVVLYILYYLRRKMKKNNQIDKDKVFQMIDLLNTKINELPRPLNQPSRKQYNLYRDIISTLL